MHRFGNTEKNLERYLETYKMTPTKRDTGKETRNKDKYEKDWLDIKQNMKKID